MASKGWISGVLLLLFSLLPTVAWADDWAKQPAPGDELTVAADRTEWLMKAQWFADDHQPQNLLALIERTRAAYAGGEREAECLRTEWRGFGLTFDDRLDATLKFEIDGTKLLEHL